MKRFEMHKIQNINSMSYYVISRLRYGNTEQKRWDHVEKTGLSSCFVHIIMVKADISFDMKKIVNIRNDINY